MSGELEKTIAGGLSQTFFPPEILPRLLEGGAALSIIILFSPVLVACALLIRFSSGAGVFFRQKRVGRGGKIFTLYKFRTMRSESRGLKITAENDQRITPVGRVLRRSKLDELPQLYNVLRGEMSFVGPRPEILEMVDLTDPRWQKVLAARPGITDPVTLEFRNEEQLLVEIEDKETFYRETIQPYKLKGYLRYLEKRRWHTDLKIIFETARCIVLPHRAPPIDENLLAAAHKIRQTG